MLGYLCVRWHACHPQHVQRAACVGHAGVLQADPAPLLCACGRLGVHWLQKAAVNPPERPLQAAACVCCAARGTSFWHACPPPAGAAGCLCRPCRLAGGIVAGMLCTVCWLAIALRPPNGRAPQAVACVYCSRSMYASPFSTRAQLPAQGTHVGFVAAHVSVSLLCWLCALAARQVTYVLAVSRGWVSAPSGPRSQGPP